MLQNDALKDGYEKARAILIDKNGNPTLYYQTYLRYKKDWMDKRKAHQTAYSNAFTNPLKAHRWGIEGKIYIDDINSAMDKWIALGYKNEIEKAITILTNNPADPAIIEMLKKNQ